MAVGTNEKILFNYLPEIEYNNDLLNEIGANTSLTLRTAETPAAGTTNYVRKFGTPVSVTACSAISDLPAGQTMVVYALDGTELGRKTAAGAFTAGGTVTAQGVYIELSGAATVVTSPESITLTGLGVHPLVMATETLGATALRLYVSKTTSTYYDEAMRYGGARHSPSVGDEDLPYFTITSAYAALAARTIVHVLDSEVYDEDLTSTGQSLDTVSTFLQAALGTTPTITHGIGARTSREVEHDGNNTDTVYVSKTGDDADPGTYQEPYLTIQFAETHLGGATYINIMDSEIYIESISIDFAVSLETLYGMTPVIVGQITARHADVNLAGFEMSGTRDYKIRGLGMTWAGTLKNLTIHGALIYGIQHNASDGLIIENNLIYNNVIGIAQLNIGVGKTSTIRNNIIYNNTSYGIHLNINGDVIIGVNDNIVYNNGTGVFVEIVAGGDYSGNFENNTIFNNSTYGLQRNFAGVVDSGVYRNNIIYGNLTYDLYRTGAQPTITESNFGTNAPAANDWTIGAGCITTDPKFCRTTAPYQFGLSADSGAYRTDTGGLDMGANLNIVEINASDVTVNGFIIDGQSIFNSGVFIADFANHTGAIVIFNTVENCQGIGLDPYDNDTDTDATIKNNIIRNCGNGLKLSYGGNTVEENLIYNNTIYGIYAQRTGDSIVHNTIVGNQYGLYLDTTVSVMAVRDNIFSQNTVNDIYSNINITVTYNSIDGALTDNVTALADTNVLKSPLFLDPENNDYNLKVTENGFFIDSPCKDKSSDSPVQDIGAWDMDRSVEDEAWRKYQLEWNPRKLDPEYNGKGVSKFENALGITNIFEKSHLRVYPFHWSPSQASTEELWKKIQYFSSLVPDRDQGRTADQCRIRVNPLPSQLLASGTAATISAATKTILDTNLDLTEDELKGYWASIKFLSGTGMTIDDALKTGTVAGTPWTVNQHAGRYIHDSGYYYRVLSNTSNVVTLSDPNDTLTSGTITWAFEKYFKMIKTENKILHLQDDDGELPTGSYDWYCDFIEMHVIKPGFKTLQERFYWLQETWKTGFKLVLEEL